MRHDKLTPTDGAVGPASANHSTPSPVSRPVKLIVRWGPAALEKADSSLISLILSKNNLTTKGATILLPALKKHTSLQHLDLTKNRLNDSVAPAVIDLLKDNTTLLSLDLSGNKSLKTKSGGRYRYVGNGQYARTPVQGRGRAQIVKSALFDTTSLQTIADSNHTCAVYMTGFNHGDSHEETIRRINASSCSEGKKIRYKVVLALSEGNGHELYNPRSFDALPLELMPKILQIIQQEIGVNGFGKGFVAKEMSNRKDRCKSEWRQDDSGRFRLHQYDDPTLRRLYEVLSGWQSFPLLFSRGAGELATKKKAAQKKKNSKGRKRKRFGDEDDDDEAWVPRGARTTARWDYNPETRRYERILPPAEFR